MNLKKFKCFILNLRNNERIHSEINGLKLKTKQKRTVKTKKIVTSAGVIIVKNTRFA